MRSMTVAELESNNFFFVKTKIRLQIMRSEKTKKSEINGILVT